MQAGSETKDPFPSKHLNGDCRDYPHSHPGTEPFTSDSLDIPNMPQPSGRGSKHGKTGSASWPLKKVCLKGHFQTPQRAVSKATHRAPIWLGIYLDISWSKKTKDPNKQGGTPNKQAPCKCSCLRQCYFKQIRDPQKGLPTNQARPLQNMNRPPSRNP